MNGPEISEISDPLFRAAVAAIDTGDVTALERFLAAQPQLLRDRLEGYGEGYFQRPYLLWFVAENPIRNGTLPANIGDVTRTMSFSWPASEATVATTSWMPDLSSSAFNLPSSEARISGERTLA